MPEAAGVGNRWGLDSLPIPATIWCVVGSVPMLRTSASTTQSALAAISALVASNKNSCALARRARPIAVAALRHRRAALLHFLRFISALAVYANCREKVQKTPARL